MMLISVFDGFGLSSFLALLRSALLIAHHSRFRSILLAAVLQTLVELRVPAVAPQELAELTLQKHLSKNLFSLLLKVSRHHQCRPKQAHQKGNNEDSLHGSS